MHVHIFKLGRHKSLDKKRYHVPWAHVSTATEGYISVFPNIPICKSDLHWYLLKFSSSSELTLQVIPKNCVSLTINMLSSKEEEKKLSETALVLIQSMEK